MGIYVVKEGDNVDQIAAENGVAVGEVLWANQIEYPYRLAVGQSLWLPKEGEVFGGEAVQQGELKPPFYSFGYAYPYIEEETLAETLPYLTDLYIFSYGFTVEGELIPPWTSDDWVIHMAREAGVGPVMVLTPFDRSGRFSNNLINTLVEQAALQERLIWEIGRTMQEKGYRGLDIDFEYVLPGDRAAFAAFVGRARRVLNTFGYQVTAALAPKTSANQRGLLYEGIDYRLLGEAADRVMLMTYEWGYTYGPPMAVAPIHMVRRVVEYAVTEIPREKISLGIPNYGYDWPLPYVREKTKAESLGNIAAVRRAVDYGVPVWFDELAKAPWYRYWQYGVNHEVWFEDPRSMEAKFDLIKEYGLTGAGYWQLMRLFRAGLLMAKEKFAVERGVLLP